MLKKYSWIIIVVIGIILLLDSSRKNIESEGSSADPKASEAESKNVDAPSSGLVAGLEQKALSTEPSENTTADLQKTKNTTQGFRPPQSLTVIRRGNSELRPGEVIYTPPRGEQIIKDKIKNLLDFLYLHPEIDPLLKMAIAHYQFEAIHPFTDGNGRTGRILNLLYLVNQGLLSQPVLYLSRYILDNKTDYYHLLAGVTQRAAWKPWLLFMMEAVEQTAKQTNQMIDDILDQKEATLLLAKSKIPWYSSEFNDLLFSQPYVKQDRFKEVLKIKSRTTLVKYANELMTHGIVSSFYDKKEVYYINNDLVRILA